MGNADTDFQLRALETMIASRTHEYEFTNKMYAEVVQQIITTSFGEERVTLTEKRNKLEERLAALGKELNDLYAQKQVYQNVTSEALSVGEEIPSDRYYEYRLDEYLPRQAHERDFLSLMDNNNLYRLYSIESSPGSGKSWLLGRFFHYMRQNLTSSPVCIVSIDPNKVITTPGDVNTLDVLLDIRDELSKLDVKFPSYDLARSATDEKDDTKLRYLMRKTFDGAIDASYESPLRQPKQAFLDDQHHPFGASTPWSNATHRKAMDLQVHALIGDVNEHCVLYSDIDHSFCIMLDLDNSLNDQAIKWIDEVLLRIAIFDDRYHPFQLRMVVAGSRTPQYMLHKPDLVNAYVLRATPLTLTDDDIIKLIAKMFFTNDDSSKQALAAELLNYYRINPDKGNIDYIMRYLRYRKNHSV